MVDVTVCVQSEEASVVRQRVHVYTGHPGTKAELEAGDVKITCMLIVFSPEHRHCARATL